MFNLIKRKNTPIKVRAYTTYDNGVHLVHPPTVSKQPDWATKLKSYSPIEIARGMLKDGNGTPETAMTVKTCPGRMELYSKGIVVPMWSDLYIKITRNGETNDLSWEYQFSDMCSEIDNHQHFQYSTMMPKGEYAHFKLVSPWNFVTDEDVDFLAIKPGWEVHDLYGLEILPGVLSFYHQSQAHVNLFIKAPKKEKEIFIKAGTPIYQFIPLSDRRAQLKIKAISPLDQEWRNISKMPRYSFKKSYRKYRTKS